MVHELALAPIGYGLSAQENSGKHCRRQSPTDDRVFVEVQVSREGASTLFQENNILQIWTHWRGVLNHELHDWGVGRD